MNMILKTEKVIKEWTDYNGHLNVAFYVRIFDIAADVMLDNFNMGGISAKKNKKTTFVAEMHTIYKQEVRLGEEVETQGPEDDDKDHLRRNRLKELSPAGNPLPRRLGIGSGRAERHAVLFADFKDFSHWAGDFGMVIVTGLPHRDGEVIRTEVDHI